MWRCHVQSRMGGHAANNDAALGRALTDGNTDRQTDAAP